MSQWYYAEGNRHRHGPLPAENLRELFRSQRIGPDTLVWCDGMPQWQPLSECAALLGLAQEQAVVSPSPPPVPPAPAAAAAAAPPARPGRATLAWIVAAVAAVLLGLVALLALALWPSIQHSLLQQRSRGALMEMQAHQASVVAFLASHGRCPVNGDNGFGAPESYAGAQLGALRIGRFDNGHCGMEGLLSVPDQDRLDGKAIWLDYHEQDHRWRCSSEIADRLLPAACRR